jgi:hypothetical protein
MRKLLHVFGLLFKQCTIFWEKSGHIWKDQSLFFHLHITCYYKYAIDLQLLAIKYSVAQVLRGNLTLQLNAFVPSHNSVIQR